MQHNTNHQSLKIEAPAKINLYLSILYQRDDGYHEIDTLMQKLQLADVLNVKLVNSGISVFCPDSDLPENEDNLVWRAADIFLKEIDSAAGVEIELKKMIPVAAGLGGGSSDAAAVLKALNCLCSAGLDNDRLSKIAASLGADVPFFVHGHNAAYAKGIGERIESTFGLGKCWILLVNPGFAVSTQWVYDNLALTSRENPNILASGKDCPTQLNSVSGGVFSHLPEPCFFNDLEAVTLSRYQEVGELKKRMLDDGCDIALMSGSGPTVFAVFSDREKAQNSYRAFAGDFEAVYLTSPL